VLKRPKYYRTIEQICALEKLHALTKKSTGNTERRIDVRKCKVLSKKSKSEKLIFKNVQKMK
jgi:hypothetical protein